MDTYFPLLKNTHYFIIKGFNIIKKCANNYSLKKNHLKIQQNECNNVFLF